MQQFLIRKEVVRSCIKIILIVLMCFVLQKHVLKMFSVMMSSEWVIVIRHVNTLAPEINDLHDLQQAGI